MNRGFLIVAIGTAITASGAFAQQQSQSQVLGRGRGGAPFAWNDTDKDGICDVTGRPVGQNRPVGWAGGRGGGRRGGPHAWGDLNQDGVCDYSGRSVGAWRRGGRSSEPQQPAESQPAPESEKR